MYETGSRGTRGVVRARLADDPVDDWLGDLCDDDWSENATGCARHRGAKPSSEELSAFEGDRRSRLSHRPDSHGPAAVANAPAVVRRRRLVAGLVLAVVLGLAVVVPLLVLRGGAKPPAATVPVPRVQTPAAEDRPTPAPATPSTTTTSTRSTSAFSLPEGTKLRLGEENDARLVRALQLALTKAGYDPGPADGTFGRQTEEAVVAFQQANGLSVDGRVGPETASALSNALARG